MVNIAQPVTPRIHALDPHSWNREDIHDGDNKGGKLRNLNPSKIYKTG